MPEHDKPSDEGTITREGQAVIREVLGERFEVIGKLGAGAFGEVYKARDNVLGRDVAIKRIRLDAFAEAGQLEEGKKRFLREAQVAAQLRHANIVTTHDIVSSPSMSFIVMELVEGQSLQALLRSRGRLSLDETIGIVEQAADALDAAHANGVVHRDVKPGNIMVEPSGHLKVMDFGIAKLETGGNLTATGNILGTPNYMSPEQARGEKIDGRSDLFSLGCILYECLSGEKPFKGESVTAILLKILTEEPPPVDFDRIGLPQALSEVLRRATAKDPGARYGSGEELIRSLKSVRDGVSAGSVPLTTGAGVAVAPSAPLPPPVPETIRRQQAEAPTVSDRRPVVLGKASVFAAVAVVGLALFFVARASMEESSGPAARPVAAEGQLVIEEEVGFIGRLLGKKPRLFVTVPMETTLELSLQTVLSSATAQPGDSFTAAVLGPVVIEGIEAVPAGSTLTGHVSHAAKAGDVSGTGELTLEVDGLALAGSDQSFDVQAAPLTFKAQTTRKKDAGLVGALAGAGAIVGGFIRGAKGAAVGGAVGASAGAGRVLTTSGNEVVLDEGSTLSVELTGEFTVTALAREAPPSD